jgi:hypothetical protein
VGGFFAGPPALTSSKQKYTPQEIIELESEGLHFLQVIPRELSFQSIEQIAGAFDNFIPGGLIKQIQKRRIQIRRSS